MRVCSIQFSTSILSGNYLTCVCYCVLASLFIFISKNSSEKINIDTHSASVLAYFVFFGFKFEPERKKMVVFFLVVAISPLFVFSFTRVFSCVLMCGSFKHPFHCSLSNRAFCLLCSMYFDAIVCIFRCFFPFLHSFCSTERL